MVTPQLTHDAEHDPTAAQTRERLAGQDSQFVDDTITGSEFTNGPSASFTYSLKKYIQTCVLPSCFGARHYPRSALARNWPSFPELQRAPGTRLLAEVKTIRFKAFLVNTVECM
jgi:hypothetical protein